MLLFLFIQYHRVKRYLKDVSAEADHIVYRERIARERTERQTWTPTIDCGTV